MNFKKAAWMSVSFQISVDEITCVTRRASALIGGAKLRSAGTLDGKPTADAPPPPPDPPPPALPPPPERTDGLSSPRSRSTIIISRLSWSPSAARSWRSAVCVPMMKGEVESFRSVQTSAGDIRLEGRYGMYVVVWARGAMSETSACAAGWRHDGFTECIKSLWSVRSPQSM